MKTNLQLFGGRGGGSGLGAGGSSAGGQYGDRNSEAAQQYRRDLADLANANMSNSDLQAAVEAYAMTHKGVDEDEMLRNVREYKDFASHPDNLSPEARKMVEDAGLKLKGTTQKATAANISDAQNKIRTLGTRKNQTVTFTNGDGDEMQANVQKVSQRTGGYTNTSYRVQVNNMTTGERTWYQYYDTASQARNAVFDHSGIPRKKQS